MGADPGHGGRQHGLRVHDKASNILLQENFSDFWAPLGITPSSFISDPYVVYDPLAGRFYVTMLGGPDSSHLDMLFAVSNDSNATDGFSIKETIHYNITDNDDLDFPKIGFNFDTVMLEANDFVDCRRRRIHVFAAIDKSSFWQATSSTFSTPPRLPREFPGHGTRPDGRRHASGGRCISFRRTATRTARRRRSIP